MQHLPISATKDSIERNRRRPSTGTPSPTAPVHPILHLQSLIGNRATLQMLERKHGPRPASAVLPPVQRTPNVPQIQRAVMTPADLRKRGGAAKKAKTPTLYGKIMQGLTDFQSQQSTGGSALVNTVDTLKTNAAAWRKKHWFQNLFNFKRAKAVRSLEKQLESEELQAWLTKEPLYEALNNPSARAKQRELESVGQQTQTGEVPLTKELGTGSFNMTFQASAPQPGNEKNKKDYAFRLNTKASNGRLEDEAREAYDRSMYLPLLSKGLGITTVPQSSVTSAPRHPLASINEFINGSTLQSRLGEGDKLEDLTDDDLQETALYDMVFQSGDAHFGNYMLEDTKEGRRLRRIDVDDVFSTPNPWFENKKDGGKTSIARAGSAVVGLPQANNMLTPQILDKIQKWDPDAMQTAMKNTPGYNGKNTFSEEQIHKVMNNINSIKNLVGKDSNRSIRELFDEYNKERVEGELGYDYDEKLNTIASFNYQDDKGNIAKNKGDYTMGGKNVSAAQKYLFFNTGLVPQTKPDIAKYAKLKNLDEAEEKSAKTYQQNKLAGPKPLTMPTLPRRGAPVTQPAKPTESAKPAASAKPANAKKKKFFGLF